MGSLVEKETYKIMSYMKNQSVNVLGGAIEDNTVVSAWTYSSGLNAKFVVTKEANGYFSFTPRNLPQGGIRKVLDNSQTKAGQAVIFTYAGSDNQLWAVEPVDARGYLQFIRSKSSGLYLTFNGENKDLSVVSKTGGKEQQWSFQELSTITCQDSAWFDSLTSPAKDAELQRIERERIERERIEKERLEKERIQREKLAEDERLEHERIERERIERERIEKERLERERLEREKHEAELAETERRLKEQEERYNKLKDEQAKQAERDLADREKLIMERKRRIIILQLELREKQLKDREDWLSGRTKAQNELRDVLVIIRTSTDQVVLKKAREDKIRLEAELVEFDKTERELEVKEKYLKEALEKLEADKKKNEAELDATMLKNRAEGIRLWELWLEYLETEVKRLGNIKIRYEVRHVPGETGGSTGGHSTTTKTQTVEEIGGERITRNVEVTETQHVVKTYEYV